MAEHLVTTQERRACGWRKLGDFPVWAENCADKVGSIAAASSVTATRERRL